MSKGSEDLLLALLQEERAVLLQGALHDLPRIAARKIALMQSIAAAPGTSDQLARIGRDLDRNAVLLKAACDGVVAAKARLDALQAVRNGLNVYTADGARHVVAQRSDTLEHKI